MDIHKPKPVHSVREFLAEIAVVVVGIALALSGEQLIEKLHDRHKAAEAREGIHGEILHNLTALGWRAASQPCIDQRIQDIAHLIDAGAEPGYVAPMWLGRPMIWEMVRARWEAASQAARTPLLTPDEQVGYGFIYAVFADIAADEAHEQIAWARLRALEGLARPGADMRDTLRLTLQEARYTNFDIKGLSRLLETNAAKLGIAGAQEASGSHANDGGICLPTATSRVEALQRLSAASHGAADEP
jgi:hypothetical protein